MSEIGFVSTGDSQKDQEILEGFLKHDRLIAEGMCPNGCGPMIVTDAHNRDCPVCKFHYWCNAPINAE